MYSYYWFTVIFYLKCILSLTIAYLLVYLTFLNYDLCSYWKKRKVIFYPPASLFSRDLCKSILIQYPQLSKIYAFARDIPSCGFFQFRKPTILIKDPYVINVILNSDFKTFQNKRLSACTEGKQDPLSYHLLALNGEQWRTLRRKLTASFTPEKLRNMFPLLEDRVNGFLRELRVSSGSSSLDLAELSGKLSMDCIAACAFGLELDCLQDRNPDFIAMSREAFKPGFLQLIKAHLRTLHPRIFRALRLEAYNTKVTAFFCSLVKKLIQFRKEQRQTILKGDFVSILMSLLEGNNEKDSQNEENLTIENTAKMEDIIAAQVFSFFVGGFETTSITMCNALFEIARNGEVQNNIRNEIDTIIGEDEITYDKLNELKYLGYAIDEVLRLYPPVFYVQRICSEDYRIPGTDTLIQKGMEVILPILQLHHDPRYFPQPHRFLPERFTSPLSYKGTYLPFGDGPRKCIGFRFSLMELKLALCKIVRDFDFFLDPKMPKELAFEEYSRIYRVKHKVLIQFYKRNN